MITACSGTGTAIYGKNKQVLDINEVQCNNQVRTSYAKVDGILLLTSSITNG
jgi:hypothetical protein